MREGAEMDSPLQTVHVCLLQRILWQQHYNQQGAASSVDMSSLSRKCWTLEFLAACTGLDRCYTFTHCVLSGQPKVMRKFFVNLRKGCEVCGMLMPWLSTKNTKETYRSIFTVMGCFV
eukprot:1154869-Pelagomonas_calceolata.AAC.1